MIIVGRLWRLLSMSLPIWILFLIFCYWGTVTPKEYVLEGLHILATSYPQRHPGFSYEPFFFFTCCLGRLESERLVFSFLIYVFNSLSFFYYSPFFSHISCEEVLN